MVGKRLPSLQQILTNPRTNWQRLKLGNCYSDGPRLPEQIERARKYHAAVSADILTRDACADEDFTMTVGKRVFSGKGAREDAGTALNAVIMSWRDDQTVTITLSTGRLIPVRWIGEQHVREDLGFIPSVADWMKAIRPEPWMGRALRL